MMTIVTHVTLREGSEPEWDATMRDRMTAACERRGWIGAQLLIPLETPNQRVIVGTWETRAAWEAWHNDPDFTATRSQLEGLEAAPSRHDWYEVIEDLHRPGAALDAAA
jgi:heme-degrading monooxygenase HmoA